MKIENVGVIGLGALGVMYGKHLTDRLGKDHVCFLADEKRVDRYRREPVACNGEVCDFTYCSPKEARELDLVLFAVKFMGMEEAIETVRPFVGEQTLFLSVLNGVSSEEMLEEAFGEGRVLYACVQGMDAGKSGNEAFYRNMGYISIGNKDKSRDEKLEAVTEFFDRTGLAFQVPEDIVREQWSKLMLNTGVNQVTAVYGATYSLVQKEGEARTMMIEAMREVIRAAETQGVELKEADIDFWLELLATLNPEGRTSMCQDILAGRPTEVGLFSGTMLGIAKEEGLDFPVNEFLYGKIRELEEMNRQKKETGA